MLFFLAALLSESWLLLLLLGLLPWPSCRPDRLAERGGKGETRPRRGGRTDGRTPRRPSYPLMSLMSSWLAAWPASLFRRMERGVLGGDVSQWTVALSS